MNQKNHKIEQYHLHKAHPEKLQFQIYDLNTYRKRSGEKAAVAHSHSYYQIIWFFNEGGTHLIDFKTYAIKKNTVFFVPKDAIHAFDTSLNIEGWLIHFNESFFMHNDVDIFLKYNIFNSSENRCHIIKKESIDTATSYIKLIQSEIAKKQLFGREDIIRFSLKSFLIILERMHQNNKKHIKFNNHHELLFARYKELIEDNYKKGLTVSKYAVILNISGKTLTNITKANTNKSASQMISERVILEAKRLLKFTSLQISEITFKIGFKDVSYFVKYFKKHVGISPRNYRDVY